MEAIVYPTVEPFQVGLGADEKLHLHLLELPCSESKIPRRDLVAEGLADLADSEGELFPGGVHHVGEINEDSLCSLRSQPYLVSRILHGPHECAEHEIETAWLGELTPAVAAAEFFRRVLGIGSGRIDALFLQQVVLSEALVALAALDQGIAEILDVAAGLPGAGMHQDGGIEADHIVTAGDDGVPPCFLHVALELDAQRPIVPGRTEAAVDFAALKNESAALGQRQDFVHVGVGQ